jgi:hypothetical protein
MVNTFLPFSNFQKCAEVLDDKRLYKQIVECKQILNTILANTSTTTDVDNVLVQILHAAASLSNISNTTNLDVLFIRGLAIALANISSVPVIDSAYVYRLFAELENTSNTSNADIAYVRPIQASLSNLSTTTDIAYALIFKIFAQLQNQSLTSDDLAVIVHILLLLSNDVLTLNATQDNLTITLN